jgi:two-component system, OmpR family, copper resistance phosphate regulon response regulator CusR
MRILLVEDEPKTALSVKSGLEEFGYDVEIAIDGVTAKHLALANLYSLIITDIMLPKLDGRQLCKEIRKGNTEIPILMLTALGSTEEIVKGFDCGADDYLVKPFAFQELIARVKSLLKRNAKPISEQNVLTLANLCMNLNLRTVTRDAKVIDLTAKEFALLEYFLRHPGKVISKAELAKNVWQMDFDTGTNMVEVYVNYLRKKIDRFFEQKLIHTQVGMGYVLREN